MVPLPSHLPVWGLKTRAQESAWPPLRLQRDTTRYNHSIHLPIFSKSRADSHVIHDMTGNGDDGRQLFLRNGDHEVTVKGCNQRLLPMFTGNSSEIKNQSWIWWKIRVKHLVEDLTNQSKTSCRMDFLFKRYPKFKTCTTSHLSGVHLRSVNGNPTPRHSPA